jgi:hypothetical protein
MIPHFDKDLNPIFATGIHERRSPAIPMTGAMLARHERVGFEEYQCSGAAM